MTATYESMRDCRPKVKQDVLYARTPNGVIFHNATAGFQITARSGYDFASKIVPHLNGNNSIGELCAVLPEAYHPMLFSLVTSLLERDFARDAEEEAQLPDGLDARVAEHFATQINYLDHYAGGAKRRFLAARTTTVAVVGTGHVARWCALSLIRNGVAEVSVSPELELDGRRASSITAELSTLRTAGVPAAVTPRAVADDELDWPGLAGFGYVVLCGPAGSQHLARSLTAGIPDGVTLLTLTTFGRLAVVGPMTTADAAGCWMCAALRLSANGDPEHAARLWSEVAGAPAAAAAPIGHALGSMLGNLLGYEVFRAASGAMPPETTGAVILQDQDTMDVTTEPLLPHPGCTRCAGISTESTGEPAPALQPAVETRIEAGEVDRSDGVYADAQNRSVLLAPVAGVFGGYQDAPYTQLPLKIGQVSLGSGYGSQRSITAFDLHHTIGARLRALRSAAAVYAEGNGSFRAAALAAGEDLPRIDSQRLSGSVLTATATAVPHQEWVLATGWLGGQRVAVPAGAVWTFGAANAAGSFHRSGAGLAAADSAGTAFGAGLAAAIGFDRLLGAAAGAPVHRVELDRLAEDAELGYLIRSAGNLDLSLELLLLDGPGLPVLLARAIDPRRDRPVWALGSGLTAAHAASDALRDVLGVLQLGAELAVEESVDTGLPVLDSFDPYLLHPSGTAELPAVPLDWSQVAESLRADGRDALVVDVGTPDLAAGGLSVVRVLLSRDR